MPGIRSCSSAHNHESRLRHRVADPAKCCTGKALEGAHNPVGAEGEDPLGIGTYRSG